MLHIILGILKIIGIILASIIGLLLVLLVLGLFYPISYVLEGKKDGVELSAKGKVYWLFHAVSFVVWYEEKKLQYKLRLFGIPISLEPKEKKDKTSRKKNKETKRNRESKKNEKNRSSEEAGNSKESIDIKDNKGSKETKYIGNENNYSEVTDNSIEENVASTATERIEDNPKIQSKLTLPDNIIDRQKRKGTRSSEPEQEKKKKSIFVRIKLLWIRIKEFFSGVLDRIRKLKDTLKDLCGKMKSMKGQVSNIVTTLKEEDTKLALKLVKKQLIVLIKHIRPRKIKGNIHFGLEDPATTGYITSALGVIYPMFPKKLSIRPDFENEILEGDIFMKGRIQSFVLLRIAWTLYKDKHIKQIIAKFKK